MGTRNPPNKSPGGRHTISGALEEVDCKVIFPQVFHRVNRQNRLLAALNLNRLWAVAFTQYHEAEAMRLHDGGGTHA